MQWRFRLATGESVFPTRGSCTTVYFDLCPKALFGAMGLGFLMIARASRIGNTLNSDRLVLYDGLKCIAALGVVMFHANAAYKGAWYSGMFVFLFFLGYHAAGRELSTGYTWSRFKRLLVPWGFWCAVYWGLLLADGKAQFPPSNFHWGDILIGPIIHLWFLPFAFLVCVALAGMSSFGRSGLWWSLGSIPLVFAVSAGFHSALQLPSPIAQWVVSIPVCWTGFVAATRRDHTSIAVLIAGISALICFAFGIGSGSLQALIALPLCLLALSVRLPKSDAMASFGDLALGVYLLHPAVLAAISSFALLPHSAPNWILGVCGFCVSLAMVAAAKNVRLFKAVM